jgi:hypothetical protein
MKIVQSKSLGNEWYDFDSADYEEKSFRFYFDPALYSGITAIYFEATAKVNTPGHIGWVKLRDITNSLDICTLQFTATSRTRVRSADLKDVLVAAGDFAFFCKYTVGSSGGGSGGRIIVEQNDATAGRKTATYFPLSTGGNRSANTYDIPAGNYGDIHAKPRIDKFDGTKKAYLDLIMYTTSGGTAYARLYDITAVEAVAGSEVNTTQTASYHVRSGEITLVADHEYKIQIKNGTAGKYTNIINASILITSQGFTKIASVPVSFDINWTESPVGYTANGAINLYEPAKTDGADGLSYEYDQNVFQEAADEANTNIRLYNITGTAAIAGTAHLLTGAASIELAFFDTPTLPVVDSELQNEYDEYGVIMHGPACIVAIQQEDFPPSWATLPSPLQFTGYHCFMSQYIKNCLSGFVPFLTPDCVNRCW